MHTDKRTFVPCLHFAMLCYVVVLPGGIGSACKRKVTLAGCSGEIVAGWALHSHYHYHHHHHLYVLCVVCCVQGVLCILCILSFSVFFCLCVPSPPFLPSCNSCKAAYWSAKEVFWSRLKAACPVGVTLTNKVLMT
jgi:hypothetical protein